MRIQLRLLLCLFPLLAQAQTPLEIKSYLPEISGWTIAPDIEIFSPDNLYQRINGSAPLFLENNFREMTSLVYEKGEDYITIQAYRHATPTDAFGMYASERSPEMPFYPIGGEAQGDNSGLYCFAGAIYLKLQASTDSDETGEMLRNIAKGLTNKILPDAGYPELFHKFPAEGRLPNTESYTVSNYIGHEFLKNVYSCMYDLQGSRFQVFLVDAPSKDQARSVLEKYFGFTKQTESFSEGGLEIKDRYNGTIPCIWKDRYIIGLFSEDGKEIMDLNLLKQVAGML